MEITSLAKSNRVPPHWEHLRSCWLQRYLSTQRYLNISRSVAGEIPNVISIRRWKLLLWQNELSVPGAPGVGVSSDHLSEVRRGCLDVFILCLGFYVSW